MKNIFIINQHSRAIFYGIGTYTRQLVSALKSFPARITEVTLSDVFLELEVGEEDDVRFIHIPMPNIERYTRFFNKKEDERFLRNVYYILIPFIPKDEELIFHFNFQEMGTLALLLKEHFFCKIITTMHYSHWSFLLQGDKDKLLSILKNDGNDIDDEKVRELFFMEQDFYVNIADFIISISQHNYEDLLSLYGVPLRKVILIHNGLKDEYKCISKMEKEQLKKKYYIRKGEKILLYVGRIDPIKGVYYLLHAFRNVLKIREDVHLMIVGDGLEADLKQYQKLVYPFYSKVSFTGFISKEKLKEIYAIADIGIIPSIHEEFGYVAIEMQMYGIPVIANETTGLKEIIHDDINGLCIHVKKENELVSIAELTSKIIYLLEHPEKRRKYIRSGRECFMKRFELNVFVQHVKKIYSYMDNDDRSYLN